jgi:hypothetical protein
MKGNPMNSETAAAMERMKKHIAALKENRSSDSPYWVIRDTPSGGFLDGEAINDDRDILADLAIAERDDLAIDEAWLRSIGFEYERIHWITLKQEMPNGLTRRVSYRPEFSSRCLSLGINERWMPLDHITTRGQLLRLLESLGVSHGRKEA